MRLASLIVDCTLLLWLRLSSLPLRLRAQRVEEKTRAHVREHMDGGYDFMNARKAEKRLLHHKPSEYMAVPTAGEYVAPAPVYAPDARAANRRLHARALRARARACVRPSVRTCLSVVPKHVRT
jgi:hypothetical protein